MATRAFPHDSLFAVIAGPMVWVAHFLVVYVTAALACARGFFDVEVLGIAIVPFVTIVATVAALVVIGDGAFVAWRRWRAFGTVRPPHDSDERAGRHRFMALAGLMLCGLSLLATVWQALPLVLITSCR